jgi:hypothetical protein
MLNRFLSRLFAGVRARVRLGASPITESNVSQGIDWNGVYRDRYQYQRDTVLKEALLAWRLNPLARRIVQITKQYITHGIEFQADNEPAAAFLRQLWNHPLNRLGQHLGECSDELALTGNLFLLITTDAAGMSYIRVLPTDQVAEIESAANDVQQELAYLPKPTGANPNPAAIPSYWKHKRARTVVLHYAVNKLAGMKWGEPDLAPLLPWLARYAAWLEDRVRLNRFRQAFMYVVKGRFHTHAERDARQRQLIANPPNPGSILVTDDSEQWDVIHPQLDSFEANNDGLALKKFIAGGQGIPLHWLAEPESSTRTTAEAAGTPTFKTLEERQAMFLAMLKDVLEIAVQRAWMKGRALPPTEIAITAADISERDNAALALAANQIVSAFGQLAAGGFISSDEYLRIVYRFAGEVLPASRPDAPAPNVGPASASSGGGIHVDSDTGEVEVDQPA